MIDFTQPNYKYHHYLNGLMLENLLRDCKTEEQKNEVMKNQGVSLSQIFEAFALALVFCGIILFLA